MHRPDPKVANRLWEAAKPEIENASALMASRVKKKDLHAAIMAIAEACYRAGVDRGYDMGHAVFAGVGEDDPKGVSDAD